MYPNTFARTKQKTNIIAAAAAVNWLRRFFLLLLLFVSQGTNTAESKPG